MSKVISSSSPISEVGGMTVDTSLLSTHNCNVKNSRAVAYIVVHYTGNKGPDTARANAGYFRTTKTQASAHYVVDDSHIFQCVALKNVAWHVGAKTYYNECRNATAIGIEMCCTAGNYKVDEKTIENTAQLTAALCRLIGVKSSAVDMYVVRHWDVTRKECPAQMSGKNNAAWRAFLARVKAVLGGNNAEVVTMSKTPIAGTAVATAAQMKAYIKSVNSKVPQSVIDMIPLYLSEGRTEGIRGDLAFAQSCLETGNFTFKGSAVTLSQNNYCGMGVTRNGLKGNSFATPQLGIRAQIQHLKAYANREPLVNTCVDPRFRYVERGCIPYVEQLGIQENPKKQGWSAGKNYGGQILDILGRILKMKVEAPTTTASNLLRKGDQGDAVKLLQHRLNLVGAILQEDGEWGVQTDTAVRNYQYRAGLTVDGIVGPKTKRKLIQDAIIARAEGYADYLVRHKWHYKGNGYTAKATFAATKKLDKPGCSCAHFVSWVLQDVGLLQDKVLSHTKAGYGTGAKSIVNADKLIDCGVTYPNKKIVSCGLQPGDVIVHDSSIGIYAPKNEKTRVLTGRDGKTVDSNNQYKTLTVTSGYEWNHNVLAVVRVRK